MCVIFSDMVQSAIRHNMPGISFLVALDGTNIINFLPPVTSWYITIAFLSFFIMSHMCQWACCIWFEHSVMLYSYCLHENVLWSSSPLFIYYCRSCFIVIGCCIHVFCYILSISPFFSLWLYVIPHCGHCLMIPCVHHLLFSHSMATVELMGNESESLQVSMSLIYLLWQALKASHLALPLLIFMASLFI